MPIDQALNELEKYAQEFAQIGDTKEAIATNKDDFLNRWTKVNQYYRVDIYNTLNN